jgi:hypothetical protein
MRRFWLGVLCVTATFTIIAAASSSYAMSFQSMPTRTDGTQFADPDEQFDNLTRPGQVGSLNLFGSRPAGDQSRNNWYLSPWYFGGDHRTPGFPGEPNKSHQ